MPLFRPAVDKICGNRNFFDGLWLLSTRFRRRSFIGRRLYLRFLKITFFEAAIFGLNRLQKYRFSQFLSTGRPKSGIGPFRRQRNGKRGRNSAPSPRRPITQRPIAPAPHHPSAPSFRRPLRPALARPPSHPALARLPLHPVPAPAPTSMLAGNRVAALPVPVAALRRFQVLWSHAFRWHKNPHPAERSCRHV